MESTDSSTSVGGGAPQLPPGFRFHPTDEELVVHYLQKKAQSTPLPLSIIADIDLYKFDPWELPGKAVFGEKEWYFFSPRERKYPNGARPNRAATSGYWKATGTDKAVVTSTGGAQKVGVKKALVFYGGKPPRGVKTDWIMHEYRLADNKPPAYLPPTERPSLKLDDWVLCRIYKKNSHKPVDDQHLMMEEHNPYDGLMVAPSGATALSLPSLAGPESISTTLTGSFSLKRALTCSLYEAATTSNKRAMVSSSDHDENESEGMAAGNSSSSMGSLISHLQLAGGGGQGQAMPGPLGEGVFRQPYHYPGLNWYP